MTGEDRTTPRPPLMRCAATKPRLDPAAPPKKCPRPAKYGEWCRQHAESLGGWRLAPPDPEHYRELAASFWVYYRCGIVGCRTVEPHEHGDGRSYTTRAALEGSPHECDDPECYGPSDPRCGTHNCTCHCHRRSTP